MGVQCSNDGKVLALNLAGNLLSGTIPDVVFQDLPYLQVLNLAQNSLTGMT